MKTHDVDALALKLLEVLQESGTGDGNEEKMSS